MGQPIRIDAEHPEIAGWLRSITPDAELTRLTEAYTAADRRLRDLQGKHSAAQVEIGAIDETIGELPAPAMDKALTQRSRLSGLLAGLPMALARAQQQRVHAHLAWLAAVRERALAEAQRARDEIEPTMTAAHADRKHMNALELAKQSREISEADLAEEQAAYNTRQAERRAQSEDARTRLTRAEEVVSVCEIRAQQYGDEVRLTMPSSWDVAAAAVAHRTQPAARSLAAA